MGDALRLRGLGSAQAEPRATGLWFDGPRREVSNRDNLVSTSRTGPTIKCVGLDVHAETIAFAIADSAGQFKFYGPSAQ